MWVKPVYMGAHMCVCGANTFVCKSEFLSMCVYVLASVCACIRVNCVCKHETVCCNSKEITDINASVHCTTMPPKS